MVEKTDAFRVVVVAVLAGLLSIVGLSPKAANAADEFAFPVRTLQLEGVTVFREGDLSTLVHDLIGRDVTLSQLERAAAAITEFYRAAGYPFAYAFVPPQDVSDGAVVIAVEEGRYASLLIENESRMRDDTVRRLLGPVQPGAIIEEQSLTWALRRLDGAAGVTARGGFRATGQPGAADFVVTVEDARRTSGYVSADNFGDPGVGEVRSTASMQFDNVTGRGDRAEVRLVSGSGLFSGRVAYALPSFIRGGQYYWSAAYTAVRYELGGPFQPLEYTGATDALHIMLQGPGRGLGAVGSGTTVGPRGAADGGTPAVTPHRVHEFSAEYRRHTTTMLGVVTPWEVLTVGAEQSEEWPLLRAAGVDRYAARVVVGYLHSSDRDVLQHDHSLMRRSGLFAKLRVSLSWRLGLGELFDMQADVEGQWASKNLHSSERFSLTGPSAVRAYGAGDTSGDEGWLARVEVRRRLGEAGWSVSAFLDGGSVRVNKRPWHPDEDYSESRLGVGFGVGTPEHASFSGRIEYAFPIHLSASPYGDEAAGRWWVRATWRM